MSQTGKQDSIIGIWSVMTIVSMVGSYLVGELWGLGLWMAVMGGIYSFMFLMGQASLNRDHAAREHAAQVAEAKASKDSEPGIRPGPGSNIVQ